MSGVGRSKNLEPQMNADERRLRREDKKFVVRRARFEKVISAFFFSICVPLRSSAVPFPEFK
jgi:hypothetical protein